MNDFLLLLNHLVFFLILFGILVFVHELGHFLVAKWAGIRVEKFSIGFGSKMVGKKWGETEYCLSWFPLGGFVKLFGQEPDEVIPEEERPRAFLCKPPPARIAVVLAGPICNLLFPVFLFTALYLNGIPTLTSEIGRVEKGSAAEQAGLQEGDEVVAVDGQPLWKWSDFEKTVRRSPEKPLALQVRRGGQSLSFSATPRSKEGLNEFGEKVLLGSLGLSPYPFLACLGVADPDSAAGKAGLITGEVVRTLNGQGVRSFDDFQKKLTGLKPADEAKLALELPSEKAGEKPGRREKLFHQADFLRRGRLDLEAFGLFPCELFVRGLRADGSAEKAGVKRGDMIFAVNGRRIAGWEQFKELIGASKGEKTEVTFLRAGQPLSLSLSANPTPIANELTGQKEKQWLIGIEAWAMLGEAKSRNEREANPFIALGMGMRRTAKNVANIVVGLGKLISGRVSAESVGGPILIAKLAGSSYQQGGWLGFFNILILLSLTLGVINLLPIPVLDGGHILFSLIEWIQGKPLSPRAQNIANHLGLAVIVGIMLLAFYNDLHRFL